MPRSLSYLASLQSAGFSLMRLTYEEYSSRDLLRCFPGRRYRRVRPADGYGHDIFRIEHECQCEDVEEKNDDDEKEEDDDEEGRHVRRHGHEENVSELAALSKGSAACFLGLIMSKRELVIILAGALLLIGFALWGATYAIDNYVFNDDVQ